MAGWLLLIIGIALLLVEVIIPGFGVAGFLGLAALFAGAYFSAPTWPLRAAVAGAALGVVLLAMLLLRRLIKKHGIWNKITLQEQNCAVENLPPLQVGDEGVALSALHPTGCARFGELRIDVRCSQGFLEAGAPIKIERIEGAKIIVGRAGEKDRD